MATSPGDPFGIERPRSLERVLGIDPGITGALGLLSLPGWAILAVKKLPTISRFDRRVIDERALLKLIQELAPSLVVIEKVMPVPERTPRGDRAAGSVQTLPAGEKEPPETHHRMGTVGAFNYGWTCAQIYSTVRLAGHEPVMVHPSTWKAAAGLRGRGAEYADRKRMSVALARKHWPDFGITNDDGCAEALLIARHGLASQMHFF